ncbi:ATP-binding protein [Saccharothrix obliqua]|uniref:ATP-binding protein n=1 Tax=Saccharothrix obliqua TaxID=2861747 RepID=UPI001C5D4F13|nr:tetratricopeptide repeat protein [Saccharothrix obliqua]MBW4716888.1 tetratricopeptide repeat protein [Saccharothrix obliqua]
MTGHDRPPAADARNEVVADQVPGVVVQAGVVTGGVHLHVAAQPRPVPRQLPPAPAGFVGRANELGALTTAVDRASGGAVVISALSGVGGIGKTWLALHWAHRHVDRFPDGQLFVDLRGFSPDSEPLHPATAVRGFLDALGVDPGRVPTDLAARTALYRSLLAGRRVLVVLDNAAGVDQVAPLLPGTPTCAVLTTGRRTLAALIDRYGARHLHLDVLSHAEARALLVERLGGGRVATESDAVRELVELCGRHPLALAITARHAATRPHLPLAEVAAELRDLGLDVLDDEDPAASLRAVLSWSLRGLTPAQRAAFTLLAIAPGPDTGFPAAVCLLGRPVAEAHRVLRVLADASLVERRPGGRYAMHDLVRAYATTLADDLPPATRSAALARVVDFYLHTARGAQGLLAPHAAVLAADPPAPGVRPHPLPDQPAALAWLGGEHAHLLAAQRTAAAEHRHAGAWHLAWALTVFHQRCGHLHDDLAVWRVALDAAEHLPDPTTRVRTLRFLGGAHNRLGRHEEATEHLHRALVLAEHHDDTEQQAHAHLDLAAAWEVRGDDHRALDHARRSLDLYRARDDPAWEADALNLVGWYSARAGSYDAAREHCEAALALHRLHHNPDGEAATLDSLGYIEHHDGHHDRAVHHYHQALALYRAIGDTYYCADTLDHLGHTHVALDRPDLARATWQQALESCREQGRDADAERIQRQLDALDARPGTGHEPRANL